MTNPFRRALAALRRVVDRHDPDFQKKAQQARRLKTDAKAAAARWQHEREALKQAAAGRQRRILSPAVLEAVLPLRAQTLPARRVWARADDLDRRLQQASAAYRAAVARVDAPDPALIETTVQGLRWWIPAPPSLGHAARDRLVAKQRFPYRGVTQTRELAQGPIMIDLGANIGRMSIPRVVLGDFDYAYCAEPDPLNYAALVRNVVHNGLRGLVLPDQVAISDFCGTARLQHAKYGTGHRLAAAGDGPSVEVPCRTLDRWCAELGIDVTRVTYVKVDTQGREVHVLRGATALLAAPHVAWQIEVNPALLEDAGTSAAELIALCGRHFTHFIDLAKDPGGPRVRPASELGEALGYLAHSGQTDILTFSAAPGSRLLHTRHDD